MRTLPFLEQAALWDQWDINHGHPELRNRPLAATPLSVFVCPSTPVPTVADFPVENWMSGFTNGPTVPAGRCDYFGSSQARSFGPFPVTFGGIFDFNHNFRMRDVTDGLSNTLLIAEMAGQPIVFNRRFRPDPSLMITLQNGPWSTGNRLQMVGHDADGLIYGGGMRAVNATNRWGSNLFSFHPGGAHGVLADGSVRFIGETIDTVICRNVIGRNEGSVNGEF